jgi:hypothetical protein
MLGIGKDKNCLTGFIGLENQRRLLFLLSQQNQAVFLLIYSGLFSKRHLPNNKRIRVGFGKRHPITIGFGIHPALISSSAISSELYL